MSEARDPTQADFDLERVMELFDTALTSKDERVQNALRQLLTIVALTSTPEDGLMTIESNRGPLRQMQEDINNLSRNLQRLRDDVRIMQSKMSAPSNPYPYSGTGTGPYTLGGAGTGSYGPIMNAGGVSGSSSVSAPTNLNNFTNTVKITK